MIRSADLEFETYGSTDPRGPAAILSSPTNTGGIAVAVVAGLLATTPPTTVEAVTRLTDGTTVSLLVEAAAPFQSLSIDRHDLQTIAQVRAFRGRVAGWKGPESVPPSDRAVDEAEDFLRVYFAAGGAVRPHVGSAADGEIVLFWKNPQITIDLSLTGDGTYAFFAKTAAGRAFFEDGAPIRQQLPVELLRLLQTRA